MNLRIGLISYDYHHLKTEQVLARLLLNPLIERITLFALPFSQRKPFVPLFPHRPDQFAAPHVKHLAIHPKVCFMNWDGHALLVDQDCFVITGAGIIDPAFSCGKPILNAHPGIIPSVRGLDAFKWAIYDDIDLGVTLHLIDKEVDKGDILYIEKTMIYPDDTYESLARRHYELELNLLVNFPAYMNKSANIPCFEEHCAHRRMPKQVEKEMMARLPSYIASHSKSF